MPHLPAPGRPPPSADRDAPLVERLSAPTPAQGGAAWVLRGPETVLGHDDIWTPIETSLRASGNLVRLRCGSFTATGPGLLHAAGSLPDLPPNGRIVVHVGRSAALVAIVCGIWRAGSAYVPIATELPPARLVAMVAHLAPALVVTDDPDMRFEGFVIRAEARPFGQPVFFHRPLERAAAPEPESADAAVPDPAARPCYVVHTSGTTGAPKAIVVPHRALLNRMVAMRRLAAPTAEDAILFKTSLAFDVHVWELVLPLVSGAVSVVLEQRTHFDLASLAGLLVEARVTIAGFVPSLLALLLDRPEIRHADRLRLVFCGGEGWGAPLAERFASILPGCELRNSYGPAETTLAVANGRVLPAAAPTSAPAQIEIGPPLDNTIFLVEPVECGDPVEPGAEIVGLLLVGGPQVATGYLFRDAPGGFVTRTLDGRPLPFYATGDLVALDTATGALRYRGRLDAQIKWNGVRIEPEEVEAALRTIDGIEESAVLVSRAGERPILLATYRLRAGIRLDPAAIRSACRALLPPTHLPARFEPVEHYPRTASGKIDRAGLALDRAGGRA